MNLSDNIDTIHYNGEIWEMIDVRAENETQVKCHLRHPTRFKNNSPEEAVIVVNANDIDIR